MKHTKKKLRVDRETVRVLKAEQLGAVAGGDVGTSNWNTSDWCGRASFVTCWFQAGCLSYNP